MRQLDNGTTMTRKGGREEILAAARDVFSEHGYSTASVRTIARRAGLTQAALYYHFVNKEDLLFTIIEQFSDALTLALMRCLSRGRTPRERLEAMILTQIGFLEEHRNELKILTEEKRHLEAHRLRTLRKRERAVFEAYRSCLEELDAEGSLRAVDVTAATFAVLGMVNWVYHWYRDEGPLTLDALGRHIVDIFFNGMLHARPMRVTGGSSPPSRGHGPNGRRPARARVRGGTR